MCVCCETREPHRDQCKGEQSAASPQQDTWRQGTWQQDQLWETCDSGPIHLTTDSMFSPCNFKTSKGKLIGLL